MPIYVYETLAQAGCPTIRVEVLQGLHEPPLPHHPHTGAALHRIPTAPSLTLNHGERLLKKRLSNDHLAAHGFTKYQKDPHTGQYHKVLGQQGPECFRPD